MNEHFRAFVFVFRSIISRRCSLNHQAFAAPCENSFQFLSLVSLFIAQWYDPFRLSARLSLAFLAVFIKKNAAETEINRLKLIPFFGPFPPHFFAYL